MRSVRWTAVLSRAALVVSAFAVLASLPALTAGADTLHWNLNTDFVATTWQRPTEDLATVVPGTVRYSALTLWVDQPGFYTFASSQAFDGFLVLYEGRFVAGRPRVDAVAADAGTFASPDQGTAGFTVRLAAHVLYVVVTSGESPGQQGLAANSVSGPGKVRMSSCFVGDEPFYDDANTEVSLIDGRFCVVVTWKELQGNSGVGIPVGYRSDNSALFWFFHPRNWEIQLKVLDGCPVNGRFWVFFAGTTNVELEVEVTDLHTFTPKTYRNELGHPADAVTDTEAFATCP